MTGRHGKGEQALDGSAPGMRASLMPWLRQVEEGAVNRGVWEAEGVGC